MIENRINPDWTKRQKRKMRWAGFFLALSILILITMGAGYYYIIHRVMSISPGYDFKDLSLISRLLFLICFIIGPIALLISAYYYNRRQQRIMQLVPEHYGRVCPKCAIVMNQTDTPVSSQCPKCKALWPDAELMKYWEQYAMPARESAMWLAEKRQEYSPHKSKKWFLQLSNIRSFARRRPFAWMGMTALIILPVYLAFIHHICGNWYSTITQSIELIPYLFAGALIGRGFKQRRGKEAHCASCNYLKPPSGSENIPNCPECGHAWNEFGGTVYGTVSSKPWMFVVGILLFFIPMMRLSSTFSGIYAKAMPTSLLIPYVSGYGHFVDATAWAEINKRNLTETQRNHLATLLIETASQNVYLDTNKSIWLGSQIKKQTISPNLINDFFQNKLILNITGPENAIVGKKAIFHLEGKHLSDSTGYEVMAVPVKALQDNQSIQVDNLTTNQWQDGFLFDTNTRDGTRSAPHQPIPFSITFNSPGKHQIRIIVWHAAIPAMSYMAPIPLTQKPDGLPTLPPRAIWSKKFELTRTILVNEK